MDRRAAPRSDRPLHHLAEARAELARPVATGEPHSDEATIAGVGTAIVSRDGKRPAVVLIPGVVDAGRENPDVQRLAHGLARGLPRLRPRPARPRGRRDRPLDRQGVDVATEVLRWDDVRAGRVGFAGSWAYETSPAPALTAARSLVALLRPSTTRSQLQELLRGVSPRDQDPLRVVRGRGRSAKPRNPPSQTRGV